MAFGKNLSELRNEHGYSQSDLAAALGMTNKSISKWETGAALPGLEVMSNLAALFDMSLSALIARLQGSNARVPLLGLTGDAADVGACAGLIRDYFERLGWRVARTSEFGGLRDFALAKTVPFVDARRSLFSPLFQRQLFAENAALEWAGSFAARDIPTLVIAEGALGAFEDALGKGDFARIALANGVSNEDVSTRYLASIDCSAKNLSRKNLLASVRDALGQTIDPTSLVPNRSFLIRHPHHEMLNACTPVVEDAEKIVFLQSRQNDKRLLLERKRFGETRFYSCSIAAGNPHLLQEEEISAHEHASLMRYSDSSLSPVERTTLNIAQNERAFTIRFYDCYPYSAVVDIALPSAQSNPLLPGYLSLVREITEASAFTPLRIAFDLAHGRL